LPTTFGQPSPARFVAIALVVAFHAALIYAIVTGLAFRAVEVRPPPIITKIIAPPHQQPQPPLPPPAPDLAPPPTAFVPPPEIKIAKPPPPAPTRAITAVTSVKPAVVAEPRPAPVLVRVLPRVDAARSQTPDYPDVSRRLGEEGTVILQALVDGSGRAIAAKIVTSSGYPRLDRAAIEGVEADYRFIPGTVDGKVQPMWYTFKFIWRLR